MFNIEFKINSILIGHIYGRNLGFVDDEKCEYEYRYYSPETGKLIEGHIYHRRDSGIEKLVHSILSKVMKKL